jgi:UDP-glucose 4-epimerase
MNAPISVVTGGAGFIGSHLVDLLLAKGHEVRVIDNLSGGDEKNLVPHFSNNSFSFINQDILEIDPNSEIFRNISYVFHLAGIGDIVPSIEKPKEYFNTNIQGTVRILEAARINQVKKFVYAASSSCYGLAETPTTENSPIDPLYPYAFSKYLGEISAFHWHKVYKLPVNSICIFNAYGPRVKTTGAYGAVFGVFLKQKLAGKPFTVVGDGNQSRDFVHVSDVANAFLLAAETSISGERFNVGAGNPVSINHLVELLGGKVTYIPKRPGEPEVTYADISKITRLLNWSPKVSFEVGVNQMVEQINDWASAPLWDEANISEATKKWFEFMDSSRIQEKPE